MARPAARIPDATVVRLPLYRRAVLELDEKGTATVSSEQLAEMAGVNAAKVRKDLSYLGSFGTRGVGYEVDVLAFHVSLALGLTSDWPVVIIGLGNLGQALANYRGFTERGFPVAALVDADAAKVGADVDGITIAPIADLADLVRDQEIAIAIIATPAAVAQQVADLAVEAGIKSILNFAPTVLSVADHIPVRQVDLATELQILSFYQQRRALVDEV